MKSIVTIFLAVLFAGCYTQVRSSGDYWGYTGHHEREHVYATPDTMPQEAYQDSSYNPDSAQMDDRGRGDEGYSGDRGLIYDDPYYYNYLGYYSAPWASFNLGWGWHRPYWGLGFSSYYPYGAYGWNYDPWWNWYYAPGFSPYGCLGYGGFYGGYGLYGGGYYGGHRGFYGNGFRSGSGRRFDLGAGRTGRIAGGESRGRGGSIAPNVSGNSVARSMGRTGIAPANRLQNSTTRQNSLRSQAGMNSPRNNPRLTPQSRAGYARSYQGRPGYAQRSYGGGGGGGNRSGGAYRSNGGGGGSRSGGGGGSRSGGGGSHGGGRGK